MKKVLSFVLVLSLVLGSFSMAFAATPATSSAGLSDIKGNVNEDAIQVAYDLGIVTGNPDGTYLPAKTVSRAEFAAMITRALAVPESALTAKTSKFKDTNGYGWAVPYLAFCESKGIMLGDGNGNAMPGRTVTVNEAVTMALRAIGYTANSAELTGAWPSNYVSVAQNNSLYDDVAKNLTNVDKANAAQIIYNTLTVQKVAVNSDGETKYLEITNPNYDKNDADSTKMIAATLMNTGLDCTQSDDYVITGKDYDNTVINITKYMGASGTAYLNDDDDIVAFTQDSTALTGEMDGSDFKANGVKYTISAKAEKTTPVAIENTVDKGNAVGASIKAKIEKMDTDFADNFVTINVDLSGKTINEVYSIVGWKATQAEVVDKSDLEDIADKELLTVDFDEDDNGNIDTAGFALVGVPSLDKIAEDNVVYVYAEDTSDDYIRMVAVGTQTAKGVVTEADVDNSDYTDNYVTVEGKKYEAARFNDTSLRNDLPDLEDNTVLSLDAYGYVFDNEATGGVADKYGIVKEFDAAGGVDNAKAKIYTLDDSTKTFTFDDWKDVKWTTIAGVKAVKVSPVMAPIATPSMIGYDVDKDGVINTVDKSTKKASANAILQSTKVMKIGSSYLDIDKDVVVFDFTGADLAHATDFNVSSIKDVDTNKSLTSEVYYIQNDDNDIVALLVSDQFTEGSNDNIYAVLNKVTKVKDGSDDVQKVAGFAAGKDYTAITDDDDDVTYGTGIANIGLYVLEPNGSGNIKEANLFNTVASYDGTDSEECLVAGEVVTEVNADKDVFSLRTGDKVSAASDAIVYKAVLKDNNTKIDYYEVAKLSNIKKDAQVWAYDTKTGDDHDGIANIVIFQDDLTVAASVSELANASIASAKALVVDTTLAAGDTNLLDVLNAVAGMTATGVTLDVKADVVGAPEASTAKVATDGVITKGTTQQELNVVITIAKTAGTTVEKTIKVTVPAL